MKVRIQFTVDVDTEHWKLDNDVHSNAEIRDDVRSWAWNRIVGDSELTGVHPGTPPWAVR